MQACSRFPHVILVYSFGVHVDLNELSIEKMYALAQKRNDDYTYVSISGTCLACGYAVLYSFAGRLESSAKGQDCRKGQADYTSWMCVFIYYQDYTRRLPQDSIKLKSSSTSTHSFPSRAI